jgi:hypothetical protein
MADDGEGERSECKKVSRQTQYWNADDHGDQSAHEDSHHHANGNRPAETRSAIRRAVGANAVENALSEGNDTALTQQKSDAETSNRIDAGKDKNIDAAAADQSREGGPDCDGRSG